MGGLVEVEVEMEEEEGLKWTKEEEGVETEFSAERGVAIGVLEVFRDFVCFSMRKRIENIRYIKSKIVGRRSGGREEDIMKRCRSWFRRGLVKVKGKMLFMKHNIS